MKRIIALLLVIVALISITACSSEKKYNEHYSKETISCYEEQLSTINNYFDGKLTLDELQREFEAIYDKYGDNEDDTFLWTSAFGAHLYASIIRAKEISRDIGSETLAGIEKEIKKWIDEIEEKLYK